VAVLRHGRIQQVGTPSEVYDRPVNRWVATFVGSPRMNLVACRADGERLVGDGWDLPLASRAAARDRPLTLGMRAEDLSLDRRDAAASLPATVYAIEPLGDRTLVDVEVGTQRLRVKAPPTAAYAVGERVEIAVDLDRVHLFDADTEAALAR
jgi:multiple sugar transport system ATP-binding protein